MRRNQLAYNFAEANTSHRPGAEPVSFQWQSIGVPLAPLSRRWTRTTVASPARNWEGHSLVSEGLAHEASPR